MRRSIASSATGRSTTANGGNTGRYSKPTLSRTDARAAARERRRGKPGKAVNAPMKLNTLERALFFYLPALVLLLAFVGVCLQVGTPWPWNRVVHEDGQHTFLETIFYFEHATRELLLDAVLALAVAGAVRHFYPPSRASGDANLVRMRVWLAVWTLTALAVILGGTAYVNAFGRYYAAEARGQAILDNLAQYPTRPGAPFVWGAHWRYHLIERFAEIALAFCVAGVLWLRDGRPAARDGRTGASVYASALVVFATATLIFGLSAQPFRDPTYLGHQLRELVTHTLVTLPLAMGTCFVLARRFSVPPANTRSNLSAWPIYAAGIVGIACGAFVLIASVLLKAQMYGQKKALAELLFPHFFEHSLGYVFVSVLAGFLYLWPARNSRGHNVH
jgi:hypothetical protein